MNIHARFSPEMLPGALEWIGKSTRYIIGREVGSETGKEHYHAIFVSDTKIDAIRKRFQVQCKALGLVSKKGQENAMYGGVKEWDADWSYAAKEGNIIASNGLTEDELQELIEMGKKWRAKIDPTSPSTTNDKVKKKPFDMQIIVDKIYDSLRDEWTKIYEPGDVKKCFGAICDKVLEYRFARINDNVAFPIIQAVLYKFHPRWVERDFKDRMSRKFNVFD